MNKYENGVRHGYWAWVSWQTNLCHQGFYENGVRVGYWEAYNPNGNVISKYFYI